MPTSVVKTKACIHMKPPVKLRIYILSGIYVTSNNFAPFCWEFFLIIFCIRCKNVLSHLLSLPSKANFQGEKHKQYLSKHRLIAKCCLLKPKYNSAKSIFYTRITSLVYFAKRQFIQTFAIWTAIRISIKFYFCSPQPGFF